MAHALWKGMISFGLVSVPVQLQTAVREKSVSFHMLSKDGGCRLRRKLYCPETGEEFEYDQTTRGIEVEPDRYVVVDPGEIEKMRPAKGGAIEIEQFVKLNEIDPIYFDRVYFITPTQGGAKAYRLLHEAMKESGRIAVARFVMHQRQQLAVLRVMNEGLVLHTMHYPDEVLSLKDALPASLAAPGAVKKELAIARQLIESMTHKLDLSAYHDEYRERLEQMIDQKKGARGAVPVSDDHERAPLTNINLMDALKRSLRTTGSSRPAAGRRARRPSHGRAAA